MHIFSTLFDKNYLSRGLALYESLLKHSPAFHLYILAMDNDTELYFAENSKSNVTIIPLTDLEIFYPQLPAIRQERTRGEYCWTLTSFSIQYVLKKYNTESCTYLDADLYFFNKPQLIFGELGNNSVIITEHNYTPIYDQTAVSGKYCVQFMYFKNDTKGNEVLEYWRSSCEKWCYNRVEDGKFGDQKYLDDWTTRFDCVYVPNHIGCGLAPWNIQKYDIVEENAALYAIDRITKLKQEVIFFHFHNLKPGFLDDGTEVWFSVSYPIADSANETVFFKYINEIERVESNLSEQFKQTRTRYALDNKVSSLWLLKIVFIRLFKQLNVLKSIKNLKIEVLKSKEDEKAHFIIKRN